MQRTITIWTIIKECHIRIIPAKFGKNRDSSLGGDVLWSNWRCTTDIQRSQLLTMRQWLRCAKNWNMILNIPILFKIYSFKSKVKVDSVYVASIATNWQLHKSTSANENRCYIMTQRSHYCLTLVLENYVVVFQMKKATAFISIKTLFNIKKIYFCIILTVSAV